MKGNVWEYNFQSVLSASSLLYGFLFGAPAAIWFIFKQYEPKLKFVTVFCLYGYSMFVFGPALVSIDPCFGAAKLILCLAQLVCLFPSPAAGWIALFTATVLSTVFLLRNLAPFVIVSAKKQAAVLLGLVGYVTIIQLHCFCYYLLYSECCSWHLCCVSSCTSSMILKTRNFCNIITLTNHVFIY